MIEVERLAKKCAMCGRRAGSNEAEASGDATADGLQRAIRPAMAGSKAARTVYGEYRTGRGLYTGGDSGLPGK